MLITVTLSQGDVIDMLRDGLRRRNLIAPAEDGEFNLIVEDDSTFKLQINNVEVGAPMPLAATAPPPVARAAAYVDPSAPIPVPATGDASEFTPESVNQMLASNRTLATAGPRKADKYTPARERYKHAQQSESFEGLGKRGDDWSDEV